MCSRAAVHRTTESVSTSSRGASHLRRQRATTISFSPKAPPHVVEPVDRHDPNTRTLAPSPSSITQPDPRDSLCGTRADRRDRTGHVLSPPSSSLARQPDRLGLGPCLDSVAGGARPEPPATNGHDRRYTRMKYRLIRVIAGLLLNSYRPTGRVGCRPQRTRPFGVQCPVALLYSQRCLQR